MVKCIGRQGIKSECWKDYDDGERNGRRNCFEQNRSLWNMWEKGWVELCVLHNV